jgi:redox-sensing transcriptional repressor
MKESIPRKAVYRLSLYKRCLERLNGAAGPTISSESLAREAGVKPTQVRKDLGYCGQIGKRGLGYDVALLRGRLDDVLGHASLQPVILVGAGQLGSALLRYEEGFAKEGFEIAAAFDARPKAVADEGPTPVFPLRRMGRFIADHGVKMAILCVPSTAAQEVCNKLIDAGVQAILNFAPVVLHVPANVMVNNVNLAIELENLSYFIR